MRLSLHVAKVFNQWKQRSLHPFLVWGRVTSQSTLRSNRPRAGSTKGDSYLYVDSVIFDLRKWFRGSCCTGSGLGRHREISQICPEPFLFSKSWSLSFIDGERLPVRVD